MVDDAADGKRRQPSVAGSAELPGGDPAATILRSPGTGGGQLRRHRFHHRTEISHTFDTEGSAFDSTGALRNWWTAEDLAHFNVATKKLALQYDSYKPFPDYREWPADAGENIADVAGISAAYDGYRAALNGNSAPEQGGFSGDQQFFIAFAQNWASKYREATVRQQVMTDPHAPAEYRAATVRNVDAWYAAFDVEPGQKLYLAPAERVRIW